MTRRNGWGCLTVIWIIALSTVCARAEAETAQPKRLNVLFIVSDDLNTHLACYGDTIVKTPNLDRLAQRSVRFDRAYCQYPVCNPSRSSFLSGLRPETTRVLDQTTLLRADRMSDVIYLPEHFKANGYFTAGIGKVEHAGHHEIAWDTADDFKAGGAGDDEESPAPRVRKTPTKKQQEGKLSYEAHRATDDKDPENVDDLIAAKVVSLLEAKRDKPFFIVAGFHKPHVPHVAPKRYFDLYPPDQMRLAAVPAGDADDIPQAALASKRNYQPEMSEARQREIISAYLACVSYMDAKVGEVLDAMDREKLWDNTIVVFVGDHGWHFGEHHWWAKASLFEESARAPLTIAVPGVDGAVSPRVVEFLDLYPTLSEACDLPKPPQSQGRSLLPLLKDPQAKWDHPAYTALGTRGRSVRTEKYRYTEWDEGRAGAELYDHDADPNELTNLAKDPKYAKAVSEMKELLKPAKPSG